MVFATLSTATTAKTIACVPMILAVRLLVLTRALHFTAPQTYLHSGKNDLPPRCQWFESGQCRNGARCWYNHLPRKPPPVPLE